MSRKCMIWSGEFYMSWHLLQNACLAMESTGFDRSAGIQQNIEYVESQNSRFMAGSTSPLRSLLEANKERAITEPGDMIYALRGIIDLR